LERERRLLEGYAGRTAGRRLLIRYFRALLDGGFHLVCRYDARARDDLAPAVRLQGAQFHAQDPAVIAIEEQQREHSWIRSTDAGYGQIDVQAARVDVRRSLHKSGSLPGVFYGSTDCGIQPAGPRGADPEVL